VHTELDIYLHFGPLFIMKHIFIDCAMHLTIQYTLYISFESTDNEFIRDAFYADT